MVRPPLTVGQTVAVAKGAKNVGMAHLTDLRNKFRNAGLWTGRHRLYQANATSDNPNPERELADDSPVQFKVISELIDLKPVFSRMMDTILTLDIGNSDARADVVLFGDEDALLTNVPAVTLIAYEKILVHLRTLMTDAPTLSRTDNSWERDSDDPSLYTTATRDVPRTGKQLVNHVVAPETDKHQMQVQVVPTEVRIGTYFSRELSSGIRPTDQRACLQRIELALHAVKQAREQANMQTVTDQHQADKVFDYIFGPIIARPE